ncbi:protein dehydratase [Rhodovulum viride]|uniref:Protein dehydratase n=1 Tax=Rhodovulum viride TaxID=1231134 RepID=A0ABX9DPS5_9RHOB|nr:MaoC family dehydratase N-terminal domain-containing protein [Rhodovulum viride]RAP43237.1 protein dehydratase [Rhodovulum viride]
MDLDIEHLRGWIGREETATERLTPDLVRRFAATFDRTWPLQPGNEAPLLIHFCLAQPTVPGAELGPDGHPARGGFLPPVPLPRRMWAGGAFRFHTPLRVGDSVTRRSTIADVTLKHGRSGPLLFVTVEHKIRARGRLALTERQDLVYRAAAPFSPPAADPAAQGSSVRRLMPGPVMLFRYSALTFNGHRIHYDAPYAREVEGYPGLVVHGPMQATLLVQFAADLKGSCPSRFAFRSVSTVFDTAEMEMHANCEGDSLRLWTAQVGGPVAMEATASW